MALREFLSDILAPLLQLGSSSGPTISSGVGSPEGVVTAPVSSQYHRTDGGTGTTIYRKESGAGNTGWVGASNASGGGGGSTLLIENIQSGATYTLAATDVDKMVSASFSGAKTFTIPLNSVTAIAIGSQIAIRNANTGTLTIAIGSPGTLNGVTAGSVTLENGQELLAWKNPGSDAWEVSVRVTPDKIITAAPATDQSNWAPSGLGAGRVTVLMQPTTNSFIGGLVKGADNQEVVLVNDSDFVVMLIGEDASSTAANRFTLARGSYIILPQEAITFRYSVSKSRWRKVNVTRDLYEVDDVTQMTLPSSSTAVQNMGIHGSATTATVSTVGSTATPTNDFLEYSYWQISNSTAAGSTDVRSNAAWLLRGATADRQGFFHAGRVRFTALGATGSVYAGLLNSTAASTTQASAFTNALMLGAIGGQTTLRIFMGSATAGTPIDLGANFPVPSATAAYEYLFFSLGGGTVVQYMVRRMDTRFLAQGTLTLNLPVNTAGLGHRTGAMVGVTAAANTVQCNYLLSMGL